MNIPYLYLLLSLTLIELFNSQRSRGREHTKDDYINLQANRTVDLSSSILHITTNILIKSNKVEPIYSYRLPLLKNSSRYLINIAAKLKSTSGEEEVTNLKVTKSGQQSEDYLEYYEINFKSEPMNYEEERILIIKEDYFERLQLLPQKITLKEDQLVVFSDTINHLSFYQTNTQSCVVLLPRERTDVKDYTKKYAVRKRDKIFYEMNDVLSSLHMEPLRVHYEYDDAIVVLNYAVRTYEVSHWGNIATEDRYQIENIGAKLEGEFGRVDYDEYGRGGGKNALRRLRAKLPLRAYGLWYRDEIGNVSTSRAAREWDEVRLDLMPRFPILGGWKSNFNIGYNLPSKFHITTDGENTYSLNLAFGLPYYDLLARNYTVRVVLPEGASGVKVNYNSLLTIFFYQLF